MPVLNPQAQSIAVGEVRAALERMACSEAFRGSPQLIAFLRYVVEATLRGEADRIKGYTIAVEALGRTADFDPQADPIVRVEATRLRRTLNRYYASIGGSESVTIDLPPGSYVPAFRRCEVPACAPPVPAALEPTAAPLRGYRFGLPHVEWRHAVAGLALVLLGAASYAGLDFWFNFNTPNSQPLVTATTAEPRAAPASSRTLTAFPVVTVGPFQAAAAGATQPIADRLRSRLRDALARFDELYVLNGDQEEGRAGASPGYGMSASQYRLTASVETGNAGLVGANVRLTDTADGRIAFARTFRQMRHDGDDSAAEEAIVREVATALAQPYGIIQARERANLVNSGTGDPRYRCLLESYDYWRTYEAALHAHARDCLERATEADPTFAAGFAALAELILQEYRRGLNLRPGDAPPLERALRAARRAFELKPGSARAHQALMDVHFLRGEYAMSLAAGEKAVMLNPYNPNILACYGARLIALGEWEKGASFVKEAAANTVVHPAWHDFYLFLAAYLANDQNAAATYAAQIMSDKFALGLVARAVVAAQRGDQDAARRLIDRLVDLQPAWRDDTRGQLKKLFPADAVTDRLAHDLARAGLNAKN